MLRGRRSRKRCKWRKLEDPDLNALPETVQVEWSTATNRPHPMLDRPGGHSSARGATLACAQLFGTLVELASAILQHSLALTPTNRSNRMAEATQAYHSQVLTTILTFSGQSHGGL